MRDRRDRLLLQNGRRTQQCACRHEQDIAIPPRTHIPQDVSAQHGRTASAARASGMDVLLVIEDHHAAVLVLRHQVDPLLQQQIVQKPAPDPSQIAGEYCVVIIHIRIGRAEVTVYGVRRGRC